MDLSKKIYWKLTNKYYDLQKSIHELRAVGIEITNRCNLQCRHCYMNAVKFGEEALNTEQWKTFFNDLKKDFGNKIIVQITGGEPLFRKDIFEILTHLKDLGFTASMATNGVLLTDEKVNKLRDLVSSVSVSLDGFENSHNHIRNQEIFKLVERNIRNASSKLKHLSIKTTVYKNNLPDLESFYEFLKTLNIKEWHLFAMEPTGRASSDDGVLTKEEYLELCSKVDALKKKKDRRFRIRFEEEAGSFMYEKTCEACEFKLCTSGITSCAVLYNGDVVNCIQDDRSDLVVEGNIKSEGFKNIWEARFREHRDKKYRSCDNHYFSKKSN